MKQVYKTCRFYECGDDGVVWYGISCKEYRDDIGCIEFRSEDKRWVICPNDFYDLSLPMLRDIADFMGQLKPPKETT